MNPVSSPIHGSCVALLTRGEWRGALILGASGAGKSDLCLRLLAAGARLVSDDRTLVWASGRALWGRAPETIKDLVEARGLGLMSAPALHFARIDQIVALDGPPAERLPEPQFETLQGIAVRRVRLEAYEASTPAKLALALRGDFAALGDGS